jgi:Spy/CpxP family protein refolding chaperone
MNAQTNNGMKALVFLTLAVMMVLGAGTALAQQPGAGYGRGHGRGFDDGEFGPGHRLEMLSEHLELSDEQVASIKGIQAQGQQKNMELRKELMRLRNELQGEMLKDDPSGKIAQDLIENIGALRTEIQTNRLKNRLEVRELLTPEQRDKMLMLQGRSQRGKGHRGGGRGMGPCGSGKEQRGDRGRW